MTRGSSSSVTNRSISNGIIRPSPRQVLMRLAYVDQGRPCRTAPGNVPTQRGPDRSARRFTICEISGQGAIPTFQGPEFAPANDLSRKLHSGSRTCSKSEFSIPLSVLVGETSTWLAWTGFASERSPQTAPSTSTEARSLENKRNMNLDACGRHSSLK